MSLARRGFFAGLAGLLGGCSPATLLNVTVSRQGYTRDADIAYGADSRQKLDLYRPDKPRADGKTVIFFYGGSWEAGSKGDYLFVAQALVASGYTVANYRLYPEVRFPAFVDDGARAALQQYDWPGNVRELENTIERAVVLSSGPVLTSRDVSVMGAVTPPSSGLPSLRLRRWTPTASPVGR